MKCPRCSRRPIQEHRNSKWCCECAAELRRRPAGKLTRAQAAMARRLAGTMFIKELAKAVGTSDSNLDRWAKQNGVNINALKYPEDLVKRVCEYYAKHGKVKTAKRFPNVRLRSIVEKYATEPRQVRWTAPQLIRIAQMAGLVSYEQQAAYFDRPRANAGSIKSVWMKRFGSAGGSINGLSRCVAKQYVTLACPFYDTGYWVTKRGKATERRRIALWIDVAKHLRPNTPDHLALAIQTMASFQHWLHGPNPRKRISQILEGKL